MKVKINDTWYDDKGNNIAVVFEEFEVEGIKNTTPETHPNRRVVSGRFDSVEDCKRWADE